MLIAVLLLAQKAGDSVPEEEAVREAAQRSAPFWSGETGLILGIVLFFAAALFFWAFFIRKRPETHRGSLVLERVRRSDPAKGERYGSSGRRRRRKRRPEHPENLPRNPTLAEIGGLPPLRPDEPDPPVGDGPAQSPEPQR